MTQWQWLNCLKNVIFTKIKNYETLDQIIRNHISLDGDDGDPCRGTAPWRFTWGFRWRKRFRQFRQPFIFFGVSPFLTVFSFSTKQPAKLKQRDIDIS